MLKGILTIFPRKLTDNYPKNKFHSFWTDLVYLALLTRFQKGAKDLLKKGCSTVSTRTFVPKFARKLPEKHVKKGGKTVFMVSPSPNPGQNRSERKVLRHLFCLIMRSNVCFWFVFACLMFLLFFLRPDCTVHRIQHFFLPKSLVQTLAKNLVNILATKNWRLKGF